MKFCCCFCCCCCCVVVFVVVIVVVVNIVVVVCYYYYCNYCICNDNLNVYTITTIINKQTSNNNTTKSDFIEYSAVKTKKNIIKSSFRNTALIKPGCCCCCCCYCCCCYYYCYCCYCYNKNKIITIIKLAIFHYN